MPKQPITLFSEADKHGIITFVNEHFCEISGYSMDELIGKPHNIIRHPEMPKKLFEIFWATIEGGQVFRAIIKNRAKDQTHYWVQATVMPVLDGQEITKYVAVRHLIEHDELAKELYAQQIKSLSL